MATRAETVEFFLKQLEGRGVSARKMFGEDGICAGGRMVARMARSLPAPKPKARKPAKSKGNG